MQYMRPNGFEKLNLNGMKKCLNKWSMCEQIRKMMQCTH